MNITVSNQAPVAADDFAAVELGTSETIEVLANDRDPNGDDLLITGFSSNSLQGGAIALTDQLGLRYTPAGGFGGTDSFEYSISDGNGGTASATVNITVPNQPPVAVNDEATVNLGETVTIEVLANDTDPNGDSLSITGFSAPQGNLLGSTVAQNGNTLSYSIPIVLLKVSDRFTYTISDGNGGTSSATVNITVPNQPPVIIPPVIIPVLEMDPSLARIDDHGTAGEHDTIGLAFPSTSVDVLMIQSNTVLDKDLTSLPLP